MYVCTRLCKSLQGVYTVDTDKLKGFDLLHQCLDVK